MTVPVHVLAAVRSIPHPAIPHPRQEPDMPAPDRPWYACNANPCTCPKPTTTAPKLSPAEAARVAEFDAAPEPPEIVVERVARAIFDASNPIVSDFPDYWHRVADGEETRDRYRRLAVAAIAVMPASPVEEALARVEALAERLGDESREFYYDNRHTHENGINYVSGMSDAMEQIADRIAAAIAAPVAQASGTEAGA